MRHKACELQGCMLDGAVAKAEGTAEPWLSAIPRGGDTRFAYSEDWALGGPIIERELLHLVPWADDGWQSFLPASVVALRGPTPLIAAMRAYVASKFGDEVELPD